MQTRKPMISATLISKKLKYTSPPRLLTFSERPLNTQATAALQSSSSSSLYRLSLSSRYQIRIPISSYQLLYYKKYNLPVQANHSIRRNYFVMTDVRKSQTICSNNIIVELLRQNSIFTWLIVFPSNHLENVFGLFISSTDKQPAWRFRNVSVR